MLDSQQSPQATYRNVGDEADVAVDERQQVKQLAEIQVNKIKVDGLREERVRHRENT